MLRRHSLGDIESPQNSKRRTGPTNACFSNGDRHHKPTPKHGKLYGLIVFLR
jgi:hypothetical protein